MHVTQPCACAGAVKEKAKAWSEDEEQKYLEGLNLHGRYCSSLSRWQPAIVGRMQQCEAF